jgi:signal transduction histidine kinase
MHDGGDAETDEAGSASPTPSAAADAEEIELLGRLAWLAAHDFNNMLFAVRGYADLLIEDLSAGSADPQDLLANAKAIREAADRATAMTDRLMAFSREPSLELPDLAGAMGDATDDEEESAPS